MDEKNKKAWQNNREKTDRILAGGRIPDGEIRVCDVEKYYGSDTNITKAVDRVSFASKRRICGNHGSIGFRKDNTFEYAVYD